MIAPGIAERRQDGEWHVEPAPDTSCLLIDSAWSFSALRSEWSSLLRASASASPFLTWEWLHTWWTHLRGSSQLRIVAVPAGTELIAVAPFPMPTGTTDPPCPAMLAHGPAGSDYLHHSV